jgi:putative transposase
MPRKKLIRTNLHPYHVTIRLNNKEWFDIPLKLAWEMCLCALKKAYDKHIVNIECFVLMSNHYHMLIWTPECNLDKFMFEFNSSLSKQIRNHTGRINRIFGDRYHWCLINDERYYLSVVKYIYQNPVKASICTRVKDYPYSTFYYLYHKIKFVIPLRSAVYDFGFSVLDWDQVDMDKSEKLTHAMKRGALKIKYAPRV